MSDEAIKIEPSVGVPTTAAAKLDYQPHNPHGTERTRRLMWAIFSSLLTKPLALITPIVTVPLFLNYLGQDGYGLFRSVGALTVWLGMTNVGLTLGLINRLTQCHVTNDRESARRYVSSLGILLTAITIVMIILLSIVVPLVDWQKVIETTPQIARELPRAIWVSGVITLIGLLITVPQAIYTGYQELHRSNIWDGIGKFLTLLACIAIVRTDWGLVGVILAAAGTMVLVRIVNTIVLFAWEKPWLFPRFKYFDRSIIYGMLKQGIGLFIIASANTAIFQIDTLIIAHFRGPDEVATYSIIGQPFMLVFSVYAMILSPLWPAHGEALRRGDIDWVRRALRLSVLGGCLAIIICGLAMYFFGDQILRIWTRGAMISVPRPLVIAMTALFIMWTTMGSISILLNSAGILRVQTWFITAHAALNLIIAIALVKPFGATGVAWSITIAGLLTSAWGYPWMLRRHVFNRRWDPTPHPVAPADPPL